MYDIVLNIVYGSTDTTNLLPAQIKAASYGATVLSVLCFVMLSVAIYRLAIYIFKF